jgi:signal transduction histidine kinase
MLTGAAQRIAGGDLTSPVAITGQDELGILARALEDMRDKLNISYGELEKMTTELSSLLSVSEILTSLRDLSDLDSALGSALDKTLEVMKADSGGILLSGRDGDTLRYRAYRGLSAVYAGRVRPKVGKGIIGQVARTGEAVAVEDVANDPRIAGDRLVAEGIVSLACLPLSSKGGVLGVLWVGNHRARRFTESDLRLLGGVARQMTTAIENARLHREVQVKEEIRGELLKDIITIQEEERRRIARELHDETSQDIVSLNANLEAAAGMLPESTDRVREVLRKAQSLGVSILDEIHKLIYELRPSLLDDLGLVVAVRWLADNNLVPVGIRVRFKITGKTVRLPSSLEIVLFRVIQEAVSNIARHAHAKNAAISLLFRKKVVKIKISDDGEGFDLAEAVSSRQRPRGLGLLGMRERVEQANGRLEIRSHPGGGGTEIDIEIPLSEEAQVEQAKNTGG